MMKLFIEVGKVLGDHANHVIIVYKASAFLLSSIIITITIYLTQTSLLAQQKAYIHDVDNEGVSVLDTAKNRLDERTFRDLIETSGHRINKIVACLASFIGKRVVP
jgi:hypothetical protein